MGRRALRAATLSACVLALCGLAPAAGSGEGVEVVFLANEGVLLRGGGRGVLIDGCVREPYAGYGAVPDEVWRKLLAAEAPFERLDLVLVSHTHRDHFQAEAARELLLARPEATWVVHREVVALLADGWSRWPEVAGRVVAVSPVEGKPAVWSRDGVEAEIARLPHNPARTQPENLAHVVRLGGRTLVHVGDAYARPEQLAAAGLTNRVFDVGLLPYWYWEEKDFASALRALSGRRGNVALHVPPAEVPGLFSGVAGAPTVLPRPLDAARY